MLPIPELTPIDFNPLPEHLSVLQRAKTLLWDGVSYLDPADDGFDAYLETRGLVYICNAIDGEDAELTHYPQTNQLRYWIHLQLEGASTYRNWVRYRAEEELHPFTVQQARHRWLDAMISYIEERLK